MPPPISAGCSGPEVVRFAIAALALQMKHEEVRGDARCALRRIPSGAAVRALKRAFEDNSGKFKFALAASLKTRGVKVKGFESQPRRS